MQDRCGREAADIVLADVVDHGYPAGHDQRPVVAGVGVDHFGDRALERVVGFALSGGAIVGHWWSGLLAAAAARLLLTLEPGRLAALVARRARPAGR